MPAISTSASSAAASAPSRSRSAAARVGPIHCGSSAAVEQLLPRGRDLERLLEQVAHVEHLDAAARSASANASCSCCARATHGTPSKSSSSLLRGVSRRSSLPGRCSITVASGPTSLETPCGAVAMPRSSQVTSAMRDRAPLRAREVAGDRDAQRLQRALRRARALAAVAHQLQERGGLAGERVREALLERAPRATGRRRAQPASAACARRARRPARPRTRAAPAARRSRAGRGGSRRSTTGIPSSIVSTIADVSTSP